MGVIESLLAERKVPQVNANVEEAVKVPVNIEEADKAVEVAHDAPVKVEVANEVSFALFCP